MARIATYVFLDLETNNDPNDPRIIEFSLVAVKRKHLLENSDQNEDSPRVQNKLTMCINPGKMIVMGGSKLCNELLQYETKFTVEVFNTINSFIQCLNKPVCLIAQNGIQFDFPILKNQFEKLNVALSDDVLCADSLNAFYDVLKKTSNAAGTSSLTQSTDVTPLTTIGNVTDLHYNDDNDKNDENFATYIDDETSPLSFKQQNERTPNKPVIKRQKLTSKPRRAIFYGEDKKPEESYKLKDIYKRVVGPIQLKPHRAESDCIMTLEIAFAKAQAFVKWVDEECFPFTQIKPMMIGVKLSKTN